jgi:uncharacterized cupredoxin-like copper-binding protein
MTTRTLLAAMLLVGAALPWGGALAQDGRTIAIQAQLHETSFGLHLVPERIDARVGDTLVVEVVNQGQSGHTLVFCGDAPGGSGSDCRDKWADSQLIPAGQSVNMTLKVPKAGTFEFFCRLPGHRQGGMNGELFVQEAPGGGKKTPGPAPLLALFAAAAAALLVAPRRRSP